MGNRDYCRDKFLFDKTMMLILYLELRNWVLNCRIGKLSYIIRFEYRFTIMVSTSIIMRGYIIYVLGFILIDL